jgi:hypothetical protein
MEIMGLAIIIILVSLGLLFAVQWMLKQPAIKPVHRAKQAVVAANFLSTALGVTTECNERTIRELLQDCALTGGVTKCGPATSCDFARDKLDDLFNATLDAWGQPYFFEVRGPATVQGIRYNEPCPGEREQKIHPLPVGAGGLRIELVLELCR